MAAFGADQETIERWTSDPEPTSVPVLSCNWPAVRLFLAASTQWRRAGMAGLPAGLDYPAVATTAAWLGIAIDEDLLWRLRVLEAAALDALIERASKAR